MGLSIVTQPASEPLSLAEAKSHLRVDISDDDTLIGEYIESARVFAEGVTRRAFVAQTWDFTLDRFPLGAIKLPVQPVTSVSYVQYVDTAGSTQTFTEGTSPDVAKYDVFTDGPRSTIVPKYNQVWPDTRDHPNVVTVRFVAGYTAFPADLKQALRLLVGHQYENREAVIIGFTVIEELPLAVQSFLSPFMMRGFNGG
jgi:uncharacterized phiE125 gp8 family phage protein